jgi:ribonuclease HI
MSPNVKIFTDGSMKDGKVGTAAVLIREGCEERTLKVCLGLDKEHEVYEVEVIALQLGLQLLLEEPFAQSAAFCIDNQAVLRTIESGKAKLIPYALINLNTLLNKVLKEHRWIQLDTQWIPGHEGVDGSEKVDAAAREAGENGCSGEDDLPTHLRGAIPINPTAAKRVLTERQLQLKHFLTAAYLYLFKKANSPDCPSCVL